jgi:hypothetical protein
MRLSIREKSPSRQMCREGDRWFEREMLIWSYNGGCCTWVWGALAKVSGALSEVEMVKMF